MAANASAKALGILVEAEEFANYGGWVLDSQFEIQIGSPYLLPHGLGRRVADADDTEPTEHANQFDQVRTAHVFVFLIFCVRHLRQV